MGLNEKLLKEMESGLSVQILNDEQGVNPMIPNNMFDFSRTGLPMFYVYESIERPNPNSPLYAQQLQRVQDFELVGFSYLSTRWVSKTGEGGKARISNFVVDDGKVVIANCYIMYADREAYETRRAKNVKNQNDKTAKKKSDVREGQELDKNSKFSYEEERVDIPLEQLMREGDPLKHDHDRD
jgi:hypothetical protein